MSQDVSPGLLANGAVQISEPIWFGVIRGLYAVGGPRENRVGHTPFVRGSGDAFPKVYVGVSRRNPCSALPGCFLTVQSAGIQAPMLVIFILIFVRPL
jgi:hypothetical protein